MRIGSLAIAAIACSGMAGSCGRFTDHHCEFQRPILDSGDISLFSKNSAEIDYERLKRSDRIILLVAPDRLRQYSIPLPSGIDGFESSGVPHMGLSNEIIDVYVSNGIDVEFIALDGSFSTLDNDNIPTSFFLEDNKPECFNENVYDYALEFNRLMLTLHVEGALR